MDIALDLATNELLVGGFVLPLILALVMQSGWAEPVRAVVFAIACVVTAVVLHLADLNDTASLAQSIILVMLSAGTLYKTFWKPTSIAPEIEARTTLKVDDRLAGLRRAEAIRQSRAA